MNNSTYLIFTDASFDPRSANGVAGYMVIEVPFPEGADSERLSEYLSNSYISASQGNIHVTTQSIPGQTCARLEIEAILLAMSVAEGFPDTSTIQIYSDSKSAIDLPTRRKRLEANNFLSKKSGLALNNKDLYIEFFARYDRLMPELYWVKGHTSKSNRSEIESLFSIVDRATRRVLRDSLR